MMVTEPQSRQIELEVQAPDIAGVLLGFAFVPGKLRVVDELNLQAFINDVTRATSQSDELKMLIIEPPDRFYVCKHVKGFGGPGTLTCLQRGLNPDSIAEARHRRGVVVLIDKPVFEP